MAFFLKKNRQGDHIYLSIYESFYSPDSRGTKHRSFKSFGRVDKMIENGIDDPIAFVQAEVNRLNAERSLEKMTSKGKQISESSPKRLLGYFPFAYLLNSLDVEQHFDFMQSKRHFNFSVFDVFSSLVFARAVDPKSKYMTYENVLPTLFKKINFSYDQILEALDFIGSEYEKFIEIFTVATDDNFHIDTSKSYFDCTNFYFEIDKSNEFQAKGPSKENRKDPIVGLGLLLDANMLPIGMRMYPGNESEKPVLRNIIKDLKNQNNIQGKTIQIADKGLNCARNIIDAVNHGDGYLFSKSVKTMEKKEREWVFLKNDWHHVCNSNGDIQFSYKECVDYFEYSYKDENGNKITKNIKEKRVATFNPKLRSKKLYEIDKMVQKAQNLSQFEAKKKDYGESARYMNFVSKSGDKVTATINQALVDKDRQMAGYNVLISSEYNADALELYKVYHNLWHIEETFRIMKTELDARPVYLQKKERIIGHFVVCYVTVLLARLLQFNILEDKYGASEIFRFIRDFEVVDAGHHRYINITTKSHLIYDLQNKLKHPISNYYLTDKQIQLMHSR